jgi:hypothetical protein
MRNNFRDASYRQQIAQLTQSMEASARKAFLASIADIKSRVVLRQVRDALKAGDVSAVVSALNLDAAAYAPLSQAVAAAYGEGGAWQVDAVKWKDPQTLAKVVVRWDMTNPRATQWLADYSSSRITGGLIEDQVAAVRRVISTGYDLGRGPNDIALDIVGRIGPNGRRQGGVLGLSEQMTEWSGNMRRYLAEDPARALNMKLGQREKTAIQAALREERPLTKKQIDTIVGRYENNLLRLRGETIGRTETAQAVNAGRTEAMRQGLAKTGIPDDYVTKIWYHGGYSVNERPDHVAMDRKKVRGMNTPFMVGGFVPMQYPLDPSAGADQNVNCRCSYMVNIDYERTAR